MKKKTIVHHLNECLDKNNGRQSIDILNKSFLSRGMPLSLIENCGYNIHINHDNLKAL